jgi:chitin disaccharide deacetylase
VKKLLVRADDLGYSEGINYGIAKSVKEGIIGSVGVMKNMPIVVHGLKLLEDTDVCFGQHTNICLGKPITDPFLIPSITNENGEFKLSKEYRQAKEDFVVLDEVILKIEAQYKRFVELVGKPPRYFEGHAVASANFFNALGV